MRKAKLFLGTVLFGITLWALPGLAFAETSYTVQAGDTLWKIATAHGVTVESIQELNSLDSTLIMPGQSLIISKDGDISLRVEVSRGTSREDSIIKYAKSFIGVPYRYGGQTPKGFDCSGYVRYVYDHFGVSLPRTAGEQYYFGRQVAPEEAKPGDIVAFRTGKAISHTGIYLGGDKFISSTSSSGVKVTSIYSPYWGEHFLGFSRIIP